MQRKCNSTKIEREGKNRVNRDQKGKNGVKQWGHCFWGKEGKGKKGRPKRENMVYPQEQKG